MAILDRSLYSIGEAARLLRITNAKLRRWLEGYERRGVQYEPVLRLEPSGSEDVTWAEFVEAGFLAEYRAHVPLQRMRPIIDELRAEFEVPYPLAHFRPLVDESQRELVFKAQELVGLESDLYLVRRVSRGTEGIWQLQWAEPIARFLRKVEFDPQGVITRLRPQESSVVIDPDVEFGIPQVDGIRTETIAEAYAGGDSKEEIAVGWSLTPEDVDAALRWELLLSRKTA